jgi:hypothetical protein
MPADVANMDVRALFPQAAAEYDALTGQQQQQQQQQQQHWGSSPLLPEQQSWSASDVQHIQQQINQGAERLQAQQHQQHQLGLLQQQQPQQQQQRLLPASLSEPLGGSSAGSSMRSLELAGLNITALSPQQQQRLQALSPQQKQQLMLRLQQHRQQRLQQQQQQQGLVGMGSGNILPAQPSNGLTQNGRGLASMLSAPGGPIAADNSSSSSSRRLPVSLPGGFGQATGSLNPDRQRHTYGTVTTATAPWLSSLQGIGPRADTSNVTNMFSNRSNDGGLAGTQQRLLPSSLLNPGSSALLNPMASTSSQLNPSSSVPLFEEGFEAWKAEQTAKLRLSGAEGLTGPSISSRGVAQGIWASAGLGLGMQAGQGLVTRPGLSSSGTAAAAAAAAAGGVGDAGRGIYANSAAVNKISGGWRPVDCPEACPC